MGMSGDTALALAKSYVKKTLQGQGALKGKDGFSPTIKENPNNTDDNYRLDVTDKNGTFTTPNLKEDSKYIAETYATKVQVDELKEDLVNLHNNVDVIHSNLSIAEKMKVIKQPIAKPNGFEWGGYDVNVYRDFLGNISTDLENYDFRQCGKTYYVSPNGNDSNDGLTKNTPLKSVSTAYLKSDVNTIVCLEGIYDYSLITNERKITKSVDIIAEGDVIFAPFMPMYWSKTSGYNNVYEISRTMASNVLDRENIDSDGFFIPLTNVDGISACDNTENSWYTDGTKVYAHRKNNAVVVRDELMTLLEKPNLLIDGDFNAYIEGITFYGGGDSKGCVNCSKSADNYNNAHVFRNCKFLYATSGSGNFVDIGASAITINCISAHSKLDGFSHQAMANVASKAIEINCIAYDCGSNITGSDQASTAHSSSKIIRVNGDYSNSYGPNIQDANDGTQSWNLGCMFHDDINSVSGYPKSSVCATSGGKIWLDTCGCYNNEFTMWAISPSEIHYRNCMFDRLSTKGNGVIDEY